MIVLMLMIGGVESNPGPKSPDDRLSVAPHRSLKCALLNINSAVTVRRQEYLHSLVHNMNLDILILTETKILATDSDSIKNGIAPPGYSFQHKHRPGVYRVGGIAIIFRSDLIVYNNNEQNEFTPTTFEVLRRNVEISNELTIHIAAIYKPPKTLKLPLYLELGTLFDELEESQYEPLICGDFNCPRENSLVVCINTNLQNLLTTSSLFKLQHARVKEEVVTKTCYIF